MQQMPLTKQGSERLRKELQKLKDKDRPAIIEAIATARAHGDLKENAEYHAAREQQSFLEGRIKELESGLSNCQIIDVERLQIDDKVVFGATVTLYDEEEDQEKTYQIVGEMEADIKANLLSITSPVARALIGKPLDSEVSVQAPNGSGKAYTITKIEYL